MILLSGHSLTPARKVPLESMQLTIKERDSTATMVPADMTGIGVNSWLKDDTNPGNGIVWRVKSIRQAYNSETTTVQLEHAIGILKDTILFGDITTAKLAGKSGAEEVTAKKAMQYILGKTSDWTLGTFDYTDSNPYKFDGDSLFDAIETISDSLDDPVWTYDFSSYPFKLNITKRNTAVASELRANRNLKTISRSVDRSGMYTRFYPIGANDLHIDGDYVDRNTAAYGVVAHVETDQSLNTKKELKRWANQRLKRHAEPVVTIDVEGFELADATGEALDRLTINRVCRIPLPEFGTTIQEKITALNYPDKVKQPEVVKVTMANNRTDVTRIISDAIKRSGKGSRTSTKKGAEDRAWMEDTNDHVAMCAKGIIGTDAQGNPNWERLSKIVVDGTGIHQSVQSVQNGLVNAESRIDQTERSINLTVQAVGSNGRVTAASIMTAINNDESTIRISADKIFLEGNVSLNSVLKVMSNTATFTGLVQFGTDAATRIRIGSGYVSTPNLRIGSGTSIHMVDYYIMNTMVKEASVSGNTLTLKRFDGTTINFSRAITSWDFGWSNGTLTVTVQPGSQKTPDSVKRTLTKGTASRSGTTINVPIRAQYGSSGQYTESTGWNCSINVANVFNDMGITQARAYVTATGTVQYYGKLYYYDASSSSYKEASSSSKYWYYSDTNRSGSNTVYY